MDSHAAFLAHYIKKISGSMQDKKVDFQAKNNRGAATVWLMPETMQNGAMSNAIVGIFDN